MEPTLTLILSILAVMLSAATLIAVLLKKPGGSDVSEKTAVMNAKLNDMAADMDREFAAARQEVRSQLTEQRHETAAALQGMNDKMEAMSRGNTEYRAKLGSALQEAFNGMNRQNTESIEKMRRQNEEKLEQMRLTVDEKLTATLTTRLNSSFKTVSDQLENVYKSLGEMKELSGSVTANVTALNRVLTNVKARGTWAEVQLGSILDQTVPGMYESNFATAAGSGERVEFAVRIPSAEGRITYLPVDSKFPMEDYVRVCAAADAADAEALAAARRALEDRVLAEAKTVAKYINVPVTTPYAILYLATDALYAELLASKRGVAEKIQRDYNILLAGPTTVTALLNSLSMGFRAVAINEKANEVRLLLGAAKAQYEKFGIVLEKARRKIDEAGKSLDDAQKRNHLIQSKLRSVDAPEGAEQLLGIAENEDEIIN